MADTPKSHSGNPPSSLREYHDMSSSMTTLSASSRSSAQDALAAAGYTFAPETTRESRHDRRISVELPAYAEVDSMPPPQYAVKDEPLTLSMYLFKFGFCEYILLFDLNHILNCTFQYSHHSGSLAYSSSFHHYAPRTRIMTRANGCPIRPTLKSRSLSTKSGEQRSSGRDDAWLH